MRKVLLLAICQLFLISGILAQEKTVSGKVTDEGGNPVANASVLVRGTKIGTVTNLDGSFVLKVPATATTLTISSVSYETQNITIGNNTVFEVKLKATSNPLNEVVVVGFTTTRKKRDEAGAISSVRANQLENLPNLSVDKALQGKAAGVMVQANNGIPGGGINVRIRGGSSIQAGVDPLYVVDGVQMNTRSDAAFSESNPLSFLNPDDIESIDIIKDAATAAIYGSTAANGVVLITTKKGRAGKTRFTANYYTGSVMPIRYLDVASGPEYFQLRSEAFAFANNLLPTDLVIKRTVLNELRFPDAATYTMAQADSAIATIPTYDWQQEAINNGRISNYEIAASGGNERSTFRVSANYTDQSTIVTKADFKRYGLKVDLTNKATDRLTFGLSTSVSSFEQHVPFAVSGSFLGSPAFSSSGIIPTNPIYKPDGTYYGTPGNVPANIVGVLNQNIIQVNDFNSGFQRTNQLVGNFNAEFKIFDWLSVKGFAGIDFRDLNGKRVSDSRTADAYNRKGLVQLEHDYNTNINTFATLNFNRSFGADHKLDGFVGYEFRKENQINTFESGDGFPTFQFTSLSNAANPLTIGETFTGFRRNAVFTNVNYAFREKYLAGVVVRYDGSSRFGSGYRYGTFAGVKTAWNIDRESFLENSRVVSALRLRFSYGETGNDQIGNFDGLGLYGGAGVYNNAAGIGYSQLENPSLKWEQTSTWNIGTDFGFLNSRINGSIELYLKKTEDLLLNQPLQQTTGFSSIATNIGKLRNRGIEVTIGADIFKPKSAGEFGWNVNLTFAYNEQEVMELYGGFKILPSNTSIRVGEPVGVLFSQRFAGVSPATGRPMWYDSLGNLTYQVLAKDRVVIGPTLLSPYTGGFRSTFRYKGVTLDVFLQGEYGRWATDGQINFLYENTGRINLLQDIYDHRWTTPGQITHVPRFNVNSSEPKGSGPQSGNRMWFKADYIRLKNILLSYDIPAKWVTKAKLTNARIYLQATNLLTYSDYFSYDIEFVNTSTGIIPQTKNVTAGIQIGF
ncbi:MAG TPA: TonB-dependent receptor [Chitinophagaceae bacterium]|nr:TonB-dependent receptor [Chitinophagaceae bacterium]